jgi:hypothetical protein
MPDLENRILILALVAFWLWLGLLPTCRLARVPLAGFIAAILSWGSAALSLPWVVAVLQQRGLWPLV